jgi:hypothetical protein
VPHPHHPPAGKKSKLCERNLRSSKPSPATPRIEENSLFSRVSYGKANEVFSHLPAGCQMFEIEGGILTSQQRTRSRKRITSDCFFFWISSTYLRAPIWNQSALMNRTIAKRVNRIIGINSRQILSQFEGREYVPCRRGRSSVVVDVALERLKGKMISSARCCVWDASKLGEREPNRIHQPALTLTLVYA